VFDVCLVFVLKYIPGFIQIEIMSSCEIIANYRQLPRISSEASILSLYHKAGIFSISLHPPEGLLQAHIATSEKKNNIGSLVQRLLFVRYVSVW